MDDPFNFIFRYSWTMPIYEFYCEDCHTIFNFFSKRVNTERIPACPKCTRPRLARQVSLFSLSKGRREDDGDDVLADVDESKLEQAMMSMAGEVESMDEDDPRQAARLIRKLFDTTGVTLRGGMEEAIRRMEAGEDPDRIEEEMGDVLEEEDPFSMRPKATFNDLRRRLLPPTIDETLYDL